MVSPLNLFATGLLVASALAAPSSTSRFTQRLARRRDGIHQGRPLNVIESASLSNNTSQVDYSSNWAGAVYDSYPLGSFNAVTAQFVVPSPSVPSGSSSSGTYSASAWVGIDGDTCSDAILQTGVDFTIDNGQVSYDAWYEWYPDYAHDFSGIDISAGDTIKITVTASSTTEGKAVIENTTTGQTVSKSITSSSALCEQNAEWIVEDFEEGSSFVPFADFGTVTFTEASASLVSGGSVGPDQASLLDIQQNRILTSSSTTSSTVKVTYRS